MSVASQAGDFEIHHHVQDGGSNDDTVAILERWAGMVEFGVLPQLCRKFTFSYSTEPDGGMYDALVKAFARHQGSPADWLGWINADDILMPGAAATIAAVDRDLGEKRVTWVGGRVRVMRDHLVIAEHDRPLAAGLVQEGLCDGLHFYFVQQEGVFFRRVLWDRVDPERELGRFKLAGDWNLWRVFAHFAELHQIGWALGEFQSREGQKSGIDRRAYYAEIERIAPFEARSDALQRLAASPPPRFRLHNSWGDLALKISKDDLKPAIRPWVEERAGRRSEFAAEELPYIRRFKPETGRADVSSVSPGSVTERAESVPRIIAHDADWQFPAVTEKQAFKKVEEWLPEGGVTYLGFPWATLIDLRNNFKSSDNLEDRLDLLAQDLPDNVRVVTVCQHIHLKRIIGVMERFGVTDVFWPHAVKNEGQIGGVRVHPFPLFPVQIPEETKPLNDRKYLFSFIGAKPDRWYLTQVRAWILDELAGDGRGLVRGRDGWHYDKIVYDLQINKTGAEPDALIDNEASTVFKAVLADTVFALCPSGSGPNSIRLWEAIGAGAIPVILADTWVAPGSPALWSEACVFCPETREDVKALPVQLEQMRADPELMARKKKGVEQLWELYGPNTFVSDIEVMALREANRTAALPSGASKGEIKVHLFGRHATRIPLNYPALKPYFESKVELVSDPLDAEILIVGFDLDLRENAEQIVRLVDEKPSLKIVVLSEEPLWDTVWAKSWTERNTRIKLNEREIAITVLNHTTSNIYKFNCIPYYVTTRDEYVLRYRRGFEAACRLSSAATLERWRRASLRAAFYAERREGEQYGFRHPEFGVEGLSGYRTHLGAALGDGDGVHREGKGWSSDTPRQGLPDWHLDKLVALNGRTHVLSALENTHHRDYMTEKFFDAFAVGAVPAYYASSDHRVSEFADSSAFINVHGLSPEQAADHILAFEPARETADAWLEAAVRLRDIFTPETLFAERRRIAEAILEELSSVVAASLQPTG